MPLIYAPDTFKAAPGTLIDVYNLMPTPSGTYRTVNDVNRSNKGTSTSLPGRVHGLFTSILPGDTQRWFAACQNSGGTAQLLYRWTSYGGAASDVSKVGNYSTSSTMKWRFCQFGKYTIATNNSNTPQYYLDGSSSVFADLSGGVPTAAALVENILSWVIFANYTSGGTTYEDGWITSNVLDATAYNGGIASNQYSGRLLQPAGPITAIKPLHNYSVIFKRNAIYVGQYVGGAIGWNYQQVGHGTGALSQESVVAANNALYYFDPNSQEFMRFDGSRSEPIGVGVRRGLVRKLVFGLAATVRSGAFFGIHDRINKNIVWFFDVGIDTGVGGGATSFYAPAWVAYNYETNRWGSGEINSYGSPTAMTDVDGFARLEWVIEDPTLSQFSTSSALKPGIIALAIEHDGNASSPNRYAVPLSGNTLPISFQTAYVGTPTRSSVLTKVIPVFAGPEYDDSNIETGVPGSATISVKYFNTPLQAAAPSSNTAGVWDSTLLKYDVRQDAVYQSAYCTMTPSSNATTYWELEDVQFELSPAGKR